MTLLAHMGAATNAVSALESLGVRVLSIRVSAVLDRPEILIDDPGHLLDHLDRQSLDTSSVRYAERAVEVDGCRVHWLLTRLDPPAPAFSRVVAWPFPGTRS